MQSNAEQCRECWKLQKEHTHHTRDSIPHYLVSLIRRMLLDGRFGFGLGTQPKTTSTRNKIHQTWRIICMNVRMPCHRRLLFIRCGCSYCIFHSRLGLLRYIYMFFFRCCWLVLFLSRCEIHSDGRSHRPPISISTFWSVVVSVRRMLVCVTHIGGGSPHSMCVIARAAGGCGTPHCGIYQCAKMK